MNKKVMALAVAGALAAPATALAQVQIGGGLHYQYFDWDSGATASRKTDALNSSEPEIYVRGEEKLGGGLNVWFQCTSSFDVLGTTGQSSSSPWCSRNSGIGFRGGFGNFFVGTWDTPQKLVTNQARGWWGGTNTLQGGSLVLLGNGSQSNASNTGASFFRRQARTFNYHSPNWGGFTLAGALSAGNEQTALSEGSPLKPRLFSIGGLFATGPFFAGVGYEQHQDYNPGAQAVTPASAALAAGGTIVVTPAGGQAYTGGNDTNFNVSVGYTFAGAKVSALYMDNKYEINGATTTAGQELKKKGYALYLDWTIAGPHKLYAQYSSVDNTKGSSTVAVGSYAAVSSTDNGAEVMGIAYGYSFSKRTQGYVAYNEMKNDTGANFTFGTSAGTAGGKQTAIGVGLKHSF
jgi:predicted porin